MSLLWPKIHDYAAAKSAVRSSAIAAFFISGLSGALASLTLLLDHPLLGVDERAFLDAGVFLLVGWGLRRGSRITAVFGLLLWLFEAAQRYVARPGSTPTAGLVLTIFLSLYLAHGVRGTFAMPRLAAKQPDTSSPLLDNSAC